MKRILTILAMVIYILPCIACAQSFSLYDKPRIGMELGNRLLKWQENMGQDHFATSFPQVDLFLELPMLEQLSFKFGHATTVKRNYWAFYGPTDKILTFENPPGMDTTYITSAKLTENYIDAIYNYTLLKQNNYKIQLIAFIGITEGRLKLAQRDTIYAAYQGYEDLTTPKKTYLRKGIGIQSLLINGIGVKIGITQERTSKLRSTLVTNYGGGGDVSYFTEARNSIIFNLGISYQL